MDNCYIVSDDVNDCQTVICTTCMCYVPWL